MKPICTVCGRRTTPFAWLGNEPIGPKCAAKANLTPTKAPKGTRLRFAKIKPAKKTASPQTGDLFEGMECTR
jgi:hypothetical protein